MASVFHLMYMGKPFEVVLENYDDTEFQDYDEVDLLCRD